MTTSLMPSPLQRYWNNNGTVAAGCHLFTYAAGTSTPKATYTDSAGTTPHANPIVLDSKGEAVIYWSGNYKIDLKTAAGVQITNFPVDNYTSSASVADTLRADLAASSGSGLVGMIRTAIGAVATTLLKWLDRQPASVFDFMTDAQIADVQAGTYTLDVTVPVKNAIAAKLHVVFPDGAYKITDELLLNNRQTIQLSAGVTIKQFVAGKALFKAVSKDSVWVHCNGGVLYGEGSWSAVWTGNNGREEHGVQFKGCTRSGVTKPSIKNMAHSGIAIIGGDRITVDVPTIEGTHTYSTPIPALANFQNGIYITNDAIYGAADNIRIIAPDISGTAQGILREAQVGITMIGVSTVINNPNIHDITGQHAVYAQCGGMSISNPVLANIALSGIKLQSADANLNIRGFSATGVVADGLGNSMFEIATIGTGSLNNIVLSGAGDNIANGISINGTVRDLTADIAISNATAYGVLMQGVGQKDIDIRINGQTIGLDGVLIVSTNSTGIKIRPTLRECNNSNTATNAPSGVRVSSVSASVELFDPDITDTNTRMVYGVFNDTAGSTVKIRGSATLIGASDTAVRATGAITEFPSEAILVGVNGSFTSLGNVASSQPMSFSINSTSAANFVLWQQTLSDESAYLVEVVLAGKTLDSSERRALVFSGLFFRDTGGICTIQGAVDVDVDIASAGFTGLYALQSNGASDVVLLVTSGAASTYNWKAKVSVTKVI